MNRYLGFPAVEVFSNLLGFVAKYSIWLCLTSTCLFLFGCLNRSNANSENGNEFQWKSSVPLIQPPSHVGIEAYGVKDPSIVYYEGRYHVFMTLAADTGWSLVYTSFKNWSEAGAVPIVPLRDSPLGGGYQAAPQVFYFAPQKLWYLIYQAGPPMYSTTRDISNPHSWSAPKPFFNIAPEVVKNPKGYDSWLDFWNICDETKCYLFFTGDNGEFYRSETLLSEFPNGFHNTVRVMKGASNDIFEASNTYKLKGSNTYITLVEAIGDKGRYFRIWRSESLSGEWHPLGTSPMNIFASSDNVKFNGLAWAEGVSHGEMIRDSVDQTMTIDPCKPLQYLYQGLDTRAPKVSDYIKLPYKLGLLDAAGDNPIGALCKK